MEKIFKAIGDKTRLEILLIIYLNTDICLCHIEDYFDLSNSNLSRHLKELDQVGLVTSYKTAKWKYYHVSPTGRHLVETIKKIDPENVLLNKVKTKIESINKFETEWDYESKIKEIEFFR